MEDIEKIIRINTLYDYYSSLLTDKQREYFDAFYQDNMSLAEIAENYNVSRNAVFSQLNIVKDLLEEYETKLCLYTKDEKRKQIINKIKENKSGDIDKLLDELIEV